MANRSYRLGKRAEASEETGRRIVEATHALHGERGVRATTMAEIAARAGVSVGSVYHHFPSYDDAIAACGEFSLQRSPLPDETIFTGAGSQRERIGRLAAAVFGFYEKLPGLELVRRDRDSHAPLRAFFDREERRRIDLAAGAIGEAADHSSTATVSALLDLSVYSSLKLAGFDSRAAAARIAEIINAWLAARARQHRTTSAR